MLRSLDAVLDVMRVPASGDASVAVVPCPDFYGVRGERCEILVVGGGTGGVAAALAAASAGRQVVLLEETDWLGVLFCMNMQISYVSPPFGPAAFYLKGVVPPTISLGDIFRSILPYLALQVIALGIVIAFPQIALWLPSTMAR